MSWTYTQIAAADKALALTDPTGALTLAALNAQTTTGAQVPVLVPSILEIILPTLERAKVRFWWQSATVSNVKTPSAADQLVMIAYSIDIALQTLPVIPVAMQASFLAGLNALVAGGLWTQASVTAISALAIPTVPLWQPPLTINDILAERAGAT